jgi:hypothetical protein
MRTRFVVCLLGMACQDPSSPGDDDDDVSPPSCAELDLPEGLVSEGSWDPSFTLPGFTGQDGLGPGVYDFAEEPDGTLLTVGFFQYVGSERVLPLVSLQGERWEQDPRLTTLDRPTLSAVASSPDGRLAVATYSALPFDLESREGEILVSDGGELVLSATFHGAVRTMTWFGGELWVGGVFELDGEAISGLAVLGEEGWKAPPGGLAQGTGVFELTPGEGELLVGGNFWQIGGTVAENVAIWDGAAWEGLDLPNATVLALERDSEGELFAGGLMSVEGSYEVGGLARWAGGAWASVGGGLANPTFRGVVADLALHQGELYVAGCFSEAGSVRASGLARWTGSAWEALDDGTEPVSTAWFSPLACGDEGPAAVWDAQLQRLHDGGDKLWVGGFFPGLGGVPSQGVMAWQDGQWLAQDHGQTHRGMSGAARVLAVGGESCDVHVLGGITHAGELAVEGRVLREQQDEWVAVSPPTPSGAWCTGLVLQGEQMHIGCDSYESGGSVYTLQGESWQPRATFEQGGLAVLAQAPDETLWAAGGAERGYVAQEQGGVFVPLGEFDGRVASLAFGPEQIVAGGMFTEVDGQPARGVASWDGERWSTMGEGVPGMVLAVAVTEDGTVYASTADDGTPDRLILGRWDGASWTEAAEPEPGPVPAGYALYALLARGQTVVGAGFGWPASDERNVFVLDEQGFRSLRGGLPAIYVESVVLAADGLWFGGTIALAGAPDARIPSVGIAHLQ